MSDPASGDPLDDLRRRLERTQRAAGRLAEEMSRSSGGTSDTVPPAGWQAEPGEARDPDLAALRALVDLLRGLVPQELQRELADLLKELLVALRALIDWWIERLESRAQAPAEVEDIPID